MGLATAQLLASRGASLSLADLNEETLKEAASSLPGSDRHICTVIDVRSSKSVDAWINTTVERLGKLDGAVNMAGAITPATPVTEETDEHWDLTFAVNARGVFCCLRAELNAMGPGGSIVSSVEKCVLKSTWLSQHTGICWECFRADGLSCCFGILRQQSGCYWAEPNSSKGKQGCQS
jgi:NAD(P)-dependent dehydrogenase (short-subunit alcohol dehydrogenase family)